MCPARRGARHTHKVYPENLKHPEEPRGESTLWCCAGGSHDGSLVRDQGTCWQEETSDKSVLKGLNIERI